MKNIIASLDEIADTLQSEGYEKLAEELDKVSNTLEKQASKGPRGNFVFPPDSKDVNDKKGHYPLESRDQAQSALTYSSKENNKAPEGKPSWSNTLTNAQVEKRVRSKVHSEFPGIKMDKDKDKK